jgi:hypothetical protein
VARRRPQTRGNHYESGGPGSLSSSVAVPVDGGLNSVDARHLAQGITASEQRYRVVALRLLQARTCGVVVIDSRTGREYVLEQADDWGRLLASKL